jgi:hypothetical protein
MSGMLNRSTKRFARAGIAAAIVLGSLAVAAPPASADEFGMDAGPSGVIPQSLTRRYCFSGSGWTAEWRDVVDSRMENLDTQTDYSDLRRNICGPLVNTHFVLDDTIDARGSALCTARNDGADDIAGNLDDRCTDAVIRLNPDLLTVEHQRLKTACHEIGHTVGLAHGSDTTTFWNDCMVNGTVAAGAQWTRYNAHHVAHINSRTSSAS